MVVSFWWSLNDYSGLQPAKFIGLKNYIDLFTTDKYFLQSLRNTTVFVLLGMSIGPTLGLLTALLLNQKVRFQSVFRTAYYLPVMTSLVVVSTIWVMLYNQNGLFNSFLTTLGFHPVGWLSNPNVALFSVAIGQHLAGFWLRDGHLSGSAAIHPARIVRGGHDGWRQCASRSSCYITLPSLRYVIAFVYIYGIIGSYQVFDQVFVMTSGGPVHSTSTVVYYLFAKFQDLRLGQASAIAYILFAILVIFSYIELRLSRERE